MEKRPALTLVLADDHGIVREGIAAFCKSRPEIAIQGQCSDGEQAIRMILDLQPSFAILDLNLTRIGGLEVVRSIRSAQCPTKLIILSASRDETIIRELFRSGADGYVLKEGPARHVFDAISFISEGGRYLTPLIRLSGPGGFSDNADEGGAGGSASATDPVSMLSKREYEVFSFLVNGMRPRDIAKLLVISPKTVDTYRANILRKLDLNGIAGLVRFAIERNAGSTSLPC